MPPKPTFLIPVFGRAADLSTNSILVKDGVVFSVNAQVATSEQTVKDLLSQHLQAKQCDFENASKNGKHMFFVANGVVFGVFVFY